jgi:hypothetical protein
MPSVAVNPLDPKHVVIAYMDRSLVTTGYAGIGTAVSRDAGITWQHSTVPLPVGFDEGAAHPTVRFDDRGRVFVSFMSATFLDRKPSLTDTYRFLPPVTERSLGFRSNNGIFVTRSDDGGLTWNQPTAVVAHRYEEQEVVFEADPDLAIDTFRLLPNGQPNPNYGNFYVTWSRAYPLGQFPGNPANGDGDVMIAVSRDGGQSWQTQLQEQERWNDANGDGIRQEAEVTRFLYTVLPNVISPFSGSSGAPLGGAHVWISNLTIGPEGDVYVAMFYGADFAVFHSMDAGATFDGPDLNDMTNPRRKAFGSGPRPRSIWRDSCTTASGSTREFGQSWRTGRDWDTCTRLT